MQYTQRKGVSYSRDILCLDLLHYLHNGLPVRLSLFATAGFF